jgi:hypothetical protein
MDGLQEDGNTKGIRTVTGTKGIPQMTAEGKAEGRGGGERGVP